MGNCTKLLSKKKAFQKEEDSPSIGFKKGTKVNLQIESARNHTKNVKQELEQSIVRKSK